MINNRKPTFFDKDIIIDEKLFDAFRIDNIVSWSHLELWCTIQNVEINYSFFKGILCGTSVINRLFDIVLDAVKNTEFLDDFIDEPETIEIIEKLFNSFHINKIFKAKEFWIDIAYKQNYEDEYIRHFNSGIEEDNKKKYTLLNAIFKKKPLSAVKFFDKNKIAIHQNDIDFERWLLNSCSFYAFSNELMKKIYTALKNETSKLNRLAMYLN